MNIFLDLAARGHRVPIGTDLVLHDEADPEGARHDPDALGRVVERAARVYRTPLALPLMDLTLEKADLVASFGVPERESDLFHFPDAPSSGDAARLRDTTARPFRPRHAASIGALRYIAERTDLFPIGMLIGPFSLMTKLVADPIAPVALAGSGVTAAEEPAVGLVDRCLDLATATVLRSAAAQIEAGARAIIVCEPAANIVYLSPRQMRAGSDIFKRFVVEPNRQLKTLLAQHGVELVLHDCGELTSDMVSRLATALQPAMLSLGGSRKLWDDAALLPPSMVLYGNLPTKRFYSDAALPVNEVRRLTAELVRNMRRCGHPHIVGSECDVLYVPDAAATIVAKVQAMLTAPA